MREKIQLLHDELLKEAQSYRESKMEAYKCSGSALDSNYRLYQGYESALFMVVNDLRDILNLPSLPEELYPNNFGFVFNVE